MGLAVMMDNPLLACCNFIPEVEQLRQFALDLRFKGIDWTFTLDNLPQCDSWVLELQEEGPLRQTLGVVEEYLRSRSSGQNARKKTR
jgi:hypothetical protein